ncbi:MAG: disulfide bond formation protein B [Halioglobus sp.]
MTNTQHTFIAFIRQLLTSKGYWVCVLLTGIALEAVALFYQYALGDEPCQICIHIRIWVAAFTLLALIMCLLPRNNILNLIAHLLTVVTTVGLWERCKYLLDVELGRGDASCNFYLGFPEWFALDSWLPWLFEVRNLCSLTPMLPGGISMAEGLIVIASILLPISLLALGLNIKTTMNTPAADA